jgi:hypothetical protein
VSKHRKIENYALEMTGIFVSGLGMMLLVVISVWVASLIAVGSSALGEETIGDLPALQEDNERFSFLRGLEVDAGQVAGVVDETSNSEEELRNEVTSWLGDVREVQSLDIAYRDSVLDRNAQNHARYLATTCSSDRYTNWTDSLEMRVDEGYTSTFSESVFDISGQLFASELPENTIDYSRLFTRYDAVGVGVAQAPEASTCSSGYHLVFHLSEVR